jgi:hypothetical protein
VRNDERVVRRASRQGRAVRADREQREHGRRARAMQESGRGGERARAAAGREQGATQASRYSDEAGKESGGGQGPTGEREGGRLRKTEREREREAEQLGGRQWVRGAGPRKVSLRLGCWAGAGLVLGLFGRGEGAKGRGPREEIAASSLQPPRYATRMPGCQDATGPGWQSRVLGCQDARRCGEGPSASSLPAILALTLVARRSPVFDAAIPRIAGLHAAAVAAVAHAKVRLL